MYEISIAERRKHKIWYSSRFKRRTGWALEMTEAWRWCEFMWHQRIVGGLSAPFYLTPRLNCHSERRGMNEGSRRDCTLCYALRSFSLRCLCWSQSSSWVSLQSKVGNLQLRGNGATLGVRSPTPKPHSPTRMLVLLPREHGWPSPWSQVGSWALHRAVRLHNKICFYEKTFQ